MRNVLAFAMAVVIAPTALAQTFTADFGFVSASGNTKLETLNFGDKLSLQVRSWNFTQQAAFIFGKTNGVTSANQAKASLRADKRFVDRIGFFAGTSYERNRFAGFTMHTDQSIGISALALAAARDTLKIDGGGVYTNEDRVDGTSKSFPAARAGAVFKHSFGGTSAFTQTAEYIPNLQDTEQFRLNAESAVTARLTTHVFLKFSHVLRYDSKPAAGGFRKTDRILTSGLQVTY